MELQAPILGLGGWWYATHTVSRHFDDRAVVQRRGAHGGRQTPPPGTKTTAGPSKFATYRRTELGCVQPAEIHELQIANCAPPHVTPALHVCLPCNMAALTTIQIGCSLLLRPAIRGLGSGLGEGRKRNNTAVASGIGRGRTSVAMSVDGHRSHSFITRNNKGAALRWTCPSLRGMGRWKARSGGSQHIQRHRVGWAGSCTDGVLTLALCKVALRASTHLGSSSWCHRMPRSEGAPTTTISSCGSVPMAVPLVSEPGCNQGVRRKDQTYKCSCVHGGCFRGFCTQHKLVYGLRWLGGAGGGGGGHHL